MNWHQNPQGNWLARIVLSERAAELKIEVDFPVQMTVLNPLTCSSTLTPPLAFQYTADRKTELATYLVTTVQGHCSQLA